MTELGPLNIAAFGKADRKAEASEALRAALALHPAPAERHFLARRLGELSA